MSWREQYRNRRVLVLGASGFIGRRVAQRLAEAGAELYCGVREVATAEDLPGVLHQADLARPGSAAELVQVVRPAISFNLAGYGVNPSEVDPSLARRINSDLVLEFASACAGEADPSWSGQHLVHVGSAAEYGGAQGDLAETTAPNPTTLYGRTKLEGTRSLGDAARAGRLRAVAARLFTVYGPGERAGRLLPTLLAARYTRGEIPLTDGSQRRDFTFVDDVVEGLLRLGALTGNRLGPVNLATGKLETVRAFVECAARVLGIAADRLRFGALPTRPHEMAHDPVNVQLLRSLSGWAPETTIESGVRTTVASS